MTTEKHYAEVDPDGRVLQVVTVDDDSAPDPAHAGAQLFPLAEPIDWAAQPTDTSAVMWNNGAPAWVEMAPLAALVDRAISAIDSAADAVRSEVISRQTNTLEYQRVEMQARSFRAAGYPDGDVPSGVATWASAKYRDGWTARQAADDIIGTADAWYGLLDGIRDLRLHAKEDVRHAADGGEIAARVAAFKADLSNLMKGAS